MKKPVVPPVFKPFAGRTIQAKLPAAIHVPRGRGLPVIQRASRDKMPQAMDYVLVPNPDLYRQHVKQRITHFVAVMMKVWRANSHAKANSTGTPHGMGSAISSTAEAQVGVGIYKGSFPKTDAAHLMNTTVRSDKLMHGWSPSTKQTEMLNVLYSSSAATTPQHKVDNVGPDKVIDSCMTTLKIRWSARCDKGEAVPDAASLVKEAVAECLQALGSSSNAGQANYQVAIAGVNLVDGSSVFDVEREYAIWSQEFTS
ncbi:hypothetical protein [Pseudoduganella violaceinigra]|uniref:hypothetical protein n=1 Tax=Pseudoduganella violaceinigra TaxID=246602 RepID=UPI000480784C|nr:hypothetical protein [Pseudoduganella violaceinigra]